MSSNLTPQDVAECICALIARNKLWAGKKVYAYFIVNKTAGCFTNPHKSEGYKKLYKKTLEECLSQQQCAASISYKILCFYFFLPTSHAINAVITFFDRVHP